MDWIHIIIIQIYIIDVQSCLDGLTNFRVSIKYCTIILLYLSNILLLHYEAGVVIVTVIVYLSTFYLK